MKTKLCAAALAVASTLSLTISLPVLAQQSKIATLTQTGNNNSAAIDQSPQWLARATITQTGDDNVAGGEAGQGGILQLGSDAYATITQAGVHNIAGIRQEASGSRANIAQTGGDNLVSLSQFQSAFSRLDAEQDGMRNAIYLSQSGSENDVLTRQSGADIREACSPA